MEQPEVPVLAVVGAPSPGRAAELPDLPRPRRATSFSAPRPPAAALRRRRRRVAEARSGGGGSHRDARMGYHRACLYPGRARALALLPYPSPSPGQLVLRGRVTCGPRGGKERILTSAGPSQAEVTAGEFRMQIRLRKRKRRHGAEKHDDNARQRPRKGKGGNPQESLLRLHLLGMYLKNIDRPAGPRGINQLGGAFVNGPRTAGLHPQPDCRTGAARRPAAATSAGGSASATACVSKILGRFYETGKHSAWRHRRLQAEGGHPAPLWWTPSASTRPTIPPCFAWEIRDMLLSEGVCSQDTVPPCPPSTASCGIGRPSGAAQSGDDGGRRPAAQLAMGGSSSSSSRLSRPPAAAPAPIRACCCRATRPTPSRAAGRSELRVRCPKTASSSNSNSSSSSSKQQQQQPSQHQQLLAGRVTTLRRKPFRQQRRPTPQGQQSNRQSPTGSPRGGGSGGGSGGGLRHPAAGAAVLPGLRWRPARRGLSTAISNHLATEPQLLQPQPAPQQPPPQHQQQPPPPQPPQQPALHLESEQSKLNDTEPAASYAAEYAAAAAYQGYASQHYASQHYGAVTRCHGRLLLVLQSAYGRATRMNLAVLLLPFSTCRCREEEGHCADLPTCLTASCAMLPSAGCLSLHSALFCLPSPRASQQARKEVAADEGASQNPCCGCRYRGGGGGAAARAAVAAAAAGAVVAEAAAAAGAAVAAAVAAQAAPKPQALHTDSPCGCDATESSAWWRSRAGRAGAALRRLRASNQVSWMVLVVLVLLVLPGSCGTETGRTPGGDAALRRPPPARCCCCCWMNFSGDSSPLSVRRWPADWLTTEQSDSAVAAAAADDAVVVAAAAAAAAAAGGGGSGGGAVAAAADEGSSRSPPTVRRLQALLSAAAGRWLSGCGCCLINAYLPLIDWGCRRVWERNRCRNAPLFYAAPAISGLN
uniref:Paired domain-containing protein n=1 Tax=Macrostomum lignano TaxID=282301 RepID=A0A1I8FKC1_9PLAT